MQIWVCWTQRAILLEQLEGETGKVTPSLAATGSRIATVAPQAKSIRVYNRADNSTEEYEFAVKSKTAM